MYKLGAKLGSNLVAKPDAKSCAQLGAKLGANYAVICARFRKRTQKMPKITPNHEIVPFFPKNEEKYIERRSRRKKGCKKRC